MGGGGGGGDGGLFASEDVPEAGHGGVMVGVVGSRLGKGRWVHDAGHVISVTRIHGATSAVQSSIPNHTASSRFHESYLCRYNNYTRPGPKSFDARLFLIHQLILKRDMKSEEWGVRSGGFRKWGYGKIKKLGTKFGIHKAWARKLGRGWTQFFNLPKKKKLGC